MKVCVIMLDRQLDRETESHYGKQSVRHITSEYHYASQEDRRTDRSSADSAE